jgi:hypothetical protein
MRQLEKEWRLLMGAPRDTVVEKYKSTWRERVAARLIERRLSKQDISNLAASCNLLPVDPKDWSQFAHAVSAHLIVSLERNDLVRMLSTRCPYCVGERALEYILAAQGDWEIRLRDPLRDPILVLGEAYFNCKIPDVRRLLIEPIRRDRKGD